LNGPNQANNIQELIDFLSSIRRAYLDPSQSGTSGQFSSANSSERTVNISKGFQGFSNVRWFSENEKDQIDTLVAVGLKKSVQGVRALEAAEKCKQHSLSRFLQEYIFFSDADGFFFVKKLGRLSRIMNSPTL
jgi:hypothetical protein